MAEPMTKSFQSALLEKLLSSLRIPRMSEDLTGRLGGRMNLAHLISKQSSFKDQMDVLRGHVSQQYNRELRASVVNIGFDRGSNIATTQEFHQLLHQAERLGAKEFNLTCDVAIRLYR